MNQIERTRTAAQRLSKHLTDLMDLAGVHDGSGVERAAAAAIETVYETINRIPRMGRTGAACFEHSPLIYVSPNQDMRSWRTSDGNNPNQGSRRASMLDQAKRVRAAGAVVDRRVITASHYLAALDEAEVESGTRTLSEVG